MTWDVIEHIVKDVKGRLETLERFEIHVWQVKDELRID